MIWHDRKSFPFLLVKQITGFPLASKCSFAFILNILILALPYSLVAQMVKCLSTMRETWAQSLVWEDPLEKEMATHFSIPAWEIPWAEEPGRLQSTRSQELDTTY